MVVVEEAGPQHIQIISKSANFEVSPFDEKAAIEAAARLRESLEAGDKKAGAEGTLQKAKVDQQIVAVARASGCECIYTADKDIVNISKRWNIPCTALWELPLPPEPRPLFAGLIEPSS